MAGASGRVQLVTCLKKGEGYITDEEKLKRLKEANHIRLDAQVFLTLWQNQHFIPEHWKEKTNGSITFVFFHGTTLRSPSGFRRSLCLDWGVGGWRWYCSWLGRDWDSDGPSAVLAS